LPRHAPRDRSAFGFSLCHPAGEDLEAWNDRLLDDLKSLLRPNEIAGIDILGGDQ